jgi:glycosyltransferase involved in cell wall biosynthesis
MRLVLFFTRGVSLGTWARAGLLDRETALYRRLGQDGVKVSFVTYGGRDDHRYRAQLNGIRVIPLHHPRSPRRSLARLWLRHWPVLANCDVLKTNQILGAEIAVWSKWTFRKRLLVRCGYLHSRFVREETADPAARAEALRLERMAFQAADAVVVTSDRDRAYVLETHTMAPSRVRVIPNYVLTGVFRPIPAVPRAYDLVCVAKASVQKNIDGLLAALHLLRARGREVSLLLIGASADDPRLRATVAASRLRVALVGHVPNFELPRYLNAARAFVLPSRYEGQSKALLEAMSCGLPCVGTDVIGIREELRHGETGYLSPPSPEGLAEAIDAVLDDPPHAAQVGARAREYVATRYSLARIAGLERDLLHQVTHGA